ncbi:hypothetical protein BH23BAC1_BH23BAC1_46200 [soil metagenome]
MKTLLNAIIFFFVSSLAYAAAIDGGWHGKTDRTEMLLNFKTEGKKLTGIMYTSGADHPITDGKVNGSDFSFSITSNNNKIPVKGKIEGDQISLTLAYPDKPSTGLLNRVEAGKPMPVIMKARMTEKYDPVKVITPGAYPGQAAPPSDALVLFDGKDLSKWKGRDGEAKWNVHDGAFTVNKGTGDIETKDVFNDFQLHIEWKIPENITGQGQSRGNSGVFMQGIYELQVLDSHNNDTYTNGQAGSIYKQTPPLVNAMRKPGEWNVYDVIFTAPRFKEDQTILFPARITVLHNGVVVQKDFELHGNTPNVGFPKYTQHGKGPIKLQDHGDPSEPISYRNIWIREL